MKAPTRATLIIIGVALLALSLRACAGTSTMGYTLGALELTLGRVETCEKHILAHKEEMRKIRARLRALENPQGE